MKLNPKEALFAIDQINAHMDVTELIHTTGSIQNFTQSLKNLAKYVEVNTEKIGSLRGEYLRSMIELRKNLKDIILDPKMTVDDAQDLAKLNKDTLDKTIYYLNPHL